MIRSFLKTLLICTVVIPIGLSVSCSSDDGFTNSNPTIEDQSFNIEENSSSGTIVGTVIATDLDTDQQLNFTIISGNIGNSFSLSSSGVLVVNDASSIDFEETPIFELSIQVEDDFEGVADALITISIVDENEIHVVEDEAFSLDENSVIGTVVGSMTITDPENSEMFIFSFSSGNINGTFSINSDGEISVANSELLDFENNPTFALVVATEDNYGITVEAGLDISVNDVNEIHSVENLTFEIEENTGVSTVVGIINVDDQEDETYEYAIINGNDDDIFQITAQGDLEIAVSSLDYETQTQHVLGIIVADEDFEVEASITINVTNVFEIDEDAVAYYPFNGNANDESNNSFDGTVLGASLTTDRNGSLNSAYSFDGIDDYIEIANNSSFENQNYSISAWIKTNELTGAILSMSSVSPIRNNCGYYFSILEGKLRGLSNVGVGSWISLVSDEVDISNDWHHVVFTYDGSSQKLFLNGTLLSSLNTVHTVNYFENNPIKIGTYVTASGSLSSQFKGSIDEVLIYDKALNETEIMSLFDN